MSALPSDGRFVSHAAGEHLPTLDGWRAIAILLVLMCHGLVPVFAHDGLFPSARLADFALRGAIGVEIFFGLSGLLICSRLVREESRTGHIDLRAFYIKRCFRILPLYFLYLLTVAFLHAVTGEFNLSRAEWFSCLFFWRNYLPHAWSSNDRWYLGHFWSLSVEEQFYLLWPTLLLLARRGRARWVALALATVNAVWRLVNRHSEIDPMLDCLFWGCLVAILLTDEKYRRLLRRCLNPLVWSSLLVIALIGNFRNWHSHLVWIPFVIPLLMAGTLLNPNWGVSRFLAHPLLGWIGKISYGLYVWQELFLLGSHPRLAAFGIVQVFPFSFIALFLCASASYYFFEKPLLAFGHKLAKRQDTPRLVAAVASN